MINLAFCYFRAFQIDTKLYTYTFPFILYPLNHISFLASIYITVAMAYERYIAVCRPLHYRDVTTRYTVQRRTIGYATKRFIKIGFGNFILNIDKNHSTKYHEGRFDLILGTYSRYYFCQSF